MDEALTRDTAEWLYGLVAGMTVNVGHPDAQATVTIARQAMDQLLTILERPTHGDNA